ncbi:hypothetical protein E2C01_051757 [Portunus trituberculatus]|uniref:Uncharacterized protein n=1 Tax=Portunus trituberculatus TaxID=210409 RepID=A0A5B7GCN1_PORTR|nr:hypothetical protein [Portunus trituberculatus]
MAGPDKSLSLTFVRAAFLLEQHDHHHHHHQEHDASNNSHERRHQREALCGEGKGAQRLARDAWGEGSVT